MGKKAFYETMQGITTLKSGQKTNYGLGFQCDSYKGIDVVFHGGGTGSYRSYILHAPAHQLSLVFLSNKDVFLFNYVFMLLFVMVLLSYVPRS